MLHLSTSDTSMINCLTYEVNRNMYFSDMWLISKYFHKPESSLIYQFSVQFETKMKVFKSLSRKIIKKLQIFTEYPFNHQSFQFSLNIKIDKVPTFGFGSSEACKDAI